MNLRSRIALVVAASVAISVFVVAGLAFVSTRQEIQEDADRLLIRRAERLQTSFRGGPGADRGLQGIFDPNQPLQFIDANGEPTFAFGTEEVLPVSEADLQVLEDGIPSAIHTVSVGEEAVYRVITYPVDDGALMLAQNLLDQQTILENIRSQFTAIGLIGAAAAGLIASALVAGALRPMESLARAAERVARTQELDATIPVKRNDEVGRVSGSFNTMLNALAASRTQQKRLIDDASHELRTPLTALRTNIELLQRAPDMPDPDRNEILGDVGFELEQLTTLVSELVELAKDNATSDEPIMEIDLGKLVSRVADRAERRYNRKVIVESDHATVAGRPVLIERAVSNLIDNAHKWGAANTPIEVTVADGTVRVRDHGPGISQEDKDRVFDRFYRADQARTMPGSGLGLSIVEEIVAFHGGSTIIEDAPDGGAVVGFSIQTAV